MQSCRLQPLESTGGTPVTRRLRFLLFARRVDTETGETTLARSSTVGFLRFSTMVTKQKPTVQKRSQRSKTRSTPKARTSPGKKKKTRRYVYYFGDGHADGSGGMKPLLGGKGANLHEMTRIGLPVPPGFTITTEVCSYFYDHKRTYPRELEPEVAAALAKVENSVGKTFGDKERPLLVSVRSGARDSMPGMMDTILNLGMNDQVGE